MIKDDNCKCQCLPQYCSFAHVSQVFILLSSYCLDFFPFTGRYLHAPKSRKCRGESIMRLRQANRALDSAVLLETTLLLEIFSKDTGCSSIVLGSLERRP